MNPIEMNPIETNPIETNPIEMNPIEMNPIETNPIETNPIETNPIETNPIEINPMETNPIETNPVELNQSTSTRTTLMNKIIIVDEYTSTNTSIENILITTKKRTFITDLKKMETILPLSIKRNDINNISSIKVRMEENNREMDKNMPQIIKLPAQISDVPSQSGIMFSGEKKDINVSFTDGIYLSVDDINISLTVGGNLKPGWKLKIVDSRYLAEDNAYFKSVSRYNAEQSRNKILGFLEKLLLEISRNVSIILSEIREKKNVDNNICILDNLYGNISIFINNYDNMRSVYQSDGLIYSGLGNNKHRFITFRTNFIRDIILYDSNK